MGFLLYSTGLLAALVSLLVYSRQDLLYVFYANAPARLPTINAFARSETKYAHVVRNCEDAVLNTAEGILLLSCDPGRDEWNTVMGTLVNPNAPPETGLYLLDHSAATPAPPQRIRLLDFRAKPGEWHPLGLDYHAPSRRIFVINHAQSGPRIEIFRLLPTKADRAASHIGTLVHPLINAPNSVAALSETELFFTNDHAIPYRLNALASMLETYTALPLGGVVRVRLNDKGTRIKSVKTLARLPFANGIVPLNDSTLAVAALTRPSVELFTIVRSGTANDEVKLAPQSTIKTPFLPDNLRVDDAGELLIAGHPFPPSLDAIAATQRFCRDPAVTAAKNVTCPTDRMSWVAEWSAEQGLKSLYVGKDGYGTSTTAVRDSKRGVGYVVGLYEEGVLRFEE